MAKKKKDNQIACVEKINTPTNLEDNQTNVVTKVLSDDEREKRIAELKINTINKKIAENEKRLAEIKKEKGVDLSDNDNQVFVPLNEEEKEMVSQWRERVNKATKSPIAFTCDLDANGKEIGFFDTLDGYPISPTDKCEIFQAAINSATGSANHDFGYRLFSLCAAASGAYRPEKNKGDELTAVLNAMQALKPQDEIEGMLISRLISLHYQSMQYLTYCNLDGQPPQGIDNNINRSTKLFRLYNETLEALMRYRRKGEQKVVVQHVQVSGGQAIVNNGNMVAGGGGELKKNGEVTP